MVFRHHDALGTAPCWHYLLEKCLDLWAVILAVLPTVPSTSLVHMPMGLIVLIISPGSV
jgi:hypothetical protein